MLVEIKPENLVGVCHDINEDTDWKFDTAMRRYVRFSKDGKLRSLINGSELPDPELLWQHRLDLYDVARVSEMGQRLKPQPATFELWRHWQEVQNAHIHDPLQHPETTGQRPN